MHGRAPWRDITQHMARNLDCQNCLLSHTNDAQVRPDRAPWLGYHDKPRAKHRAHWW